jgi:hypothetical protein
MAGYSLAAQCGSEIIATCFTIYLGESIIANELLPKTKGTRMGWLAVSFGFGLSFGVVIFMFGASLAFTCFGVQSLLVLKCGQAALAAAAIWQLAMQVPELHLSVQATSRPT